jgi:putative endonuclease
MPFFTYILKSTKTSKLYIGHTNDLQKRITLHNTDQVISTKSKGPWEIIYYKECFNRSDAMKLEKELKSFKNRDRVLRWIENHSG